MKHANATTRATTTTATAHTTMAAIVVVVVAAAAVVETAAGCVLIKQGHARKCLGTLDTAVFLDIAVCLHVSAQIGAIGKGARTHLTLERLLARVRPNVTLQQPRPAKALAAYFALTGQRVRAYVHLECTQRRVRLLAVLAREVLLHLSTTVELAMLGETAERRIALAAAVALVACHACGRCRRRRCLFERGGRGRGRRRHGRRLLFG